MNPIKILYTYDDGKQVSQIEGTVFPKNFDELDTSKIVSYVYDYIGSVIHCKWPGVIKIHDIQSLVEMHIPFNNKPFKDKLNQIKLIIDTAINMLILDKCIHQIPSPFNESQDTDNVYIANPLSNKFITYFNIYKHFITYPSHINRIINYDLCFSNINSNNAFDKFAKDLYPSLSNCSNSDMLYHQIAYAYAKLFVDMGYMDYTEYPNITSIDITKTNSDIIEKIDSKPIIEEKFIKEKLNEVVEKQTNINIEILEKKETSLKEEEEEIAIPDKDGIISINDISSEHFEASVDRKVIKVSTSALDAFIYFLETNVQTTNELLKLVHSVIKTNDIKLTDEQYFAILIGALADMGYVTLLSKTIPSYRELMKSVMNTQFIPDEYVKPFIHQDRPICDAHEYDTFSECFKRTMNEHTVLKMFNMKHKEVTRISDTIINKVNKNHNLLGTRVALSKSKIAMNLLSNINDAIRYTIKFWIALYKQDMTPNRLKLHIYQLLYYCFKQFTMKHDEYTRVDIRSTLIEFAGDFFNGITTMQMNKTLEYVCKYGDVPTEYFNKKFKISKEVDKYRLRNVDNNIFRPGEVKRAVLPRNAARSSVHFLVQEEEIKATPDQAKIIEMPEKKVVETPILVAKTGPTILKDMSALSDIKITKSKTGLKMVSALQNMMNRSGIK